MSELERQDLARVVLLVLFVAGLIAASFWILRPFLGALVWAVMIAVATWPLMLKAQKSFGGRRWLAAAVMSLGLLLLLVVPLSAAIGTLIANADTIGDWARYLREIRLPPPPAWLGSLPLVGDSAAKAWQQAATQGIEPLAAWIAPHAGELTRWFVGKIGGFGALFVQFLLTVVFAAVLYLHGETAADGARRFGARLGGERGEAAVRLSTQAIRSVALGVVVTALVQALIGGVGLWIAGVPFAAVLTALMFLLAVAQIGAVPVLIVPIVWLYWTGSAGWGTFLLVVAVVVGALDNILRPVLIKKGADLPLLLILVGVIGGLIAFGLIGIFVGPVVLAVAHALLGAWLYDKTGQGGRK